MPVYTYRSQTITLTAGSVQTIPLDFLPTVGPDGDRLVIERIILKSEVQVDTDGSTTVAQGGWAAFVQRVRMMDQAGEFLNLTGPELRAFHWAENGRQSFPDPAAIAISQSNSTRTIRLVYDAAPKVRAKRPWDYAIPADNLVTGQIEITAATASQIGTGGGTTIDSHTITLVVECRTEEGNEIHVRRELRSVEPPSLLDMYLPINGAVCRTAFLFKYADAATGAATQDATSVTIDAAGISQIATADLQAIFCADGKQDSGAGNTLSTADPFAQTTAKAVLLLWARKDGKIDECLPHNGQILVRLVGNTITSNRLLYELVQPNTAMSTRVERARAGGSNDLRLKTEGKTMRNPRAWGKWARFMPARLPDAQNGQ